MSIHWEKIGQRYLVRFRDMEGLNRAVTVNAKNLMKYGQHVPDRITKRLAKKLEQAVLARETAMGGSIRSVERRRLLWLQDKGAYTESISTGPELIHICYINHAILIAT